MTLLRLFIAACLASFALGACKNDPPPEAEEESSGAENVGKDIDEAADEAGDEVEHMGTDQNEAVDEADEKVDEATGAD